MSDAVAVPDATKESLLEILRHAAANDRAVVEFRTVEGDDGEHLNALEITDYVATLEANAEEVPEK